MRGTSKFIEKTRLVNILDIMSAEVLSRLLDSYCFPLVTNLTVYYASAFPAHLDNLSAFESLDAKKQFLFSVCREYRSLSYECDKECQSCGSAVTLKYYAGELVGSKIYHCHLGLWDMAYPLYVGKQLIGVLFSGQVIVSADVPDWSEALYCVKDQVEWYPFGGNGADEIPQTSNQIEDISAAINAKEQIGHEHKKNLKRMVREEAVKGNMGVADLLSRYEKFKDFGKTLEQILKSLYTARIEAIKREHIHLASKELTERGNRLVEEPEQFWIILDEVVKATLPNVKGYVFYKLDQYAQGFEPARTCIYDNELISDHSSFRKFCKHVFKDLRRGSGSKQYVLYDLMTKETSDKFPKLLYDAIPHRKRVSGGACVVTLPLITGGKGLTGAFVCVCARQDEVGPGESYVSKSFLKFYVEALWDIFSILSMILDRYSIEEAQAAAWAERSHELVAPIHAVKGYQDNLLYSFRRFIKSELSDDSKAKTVFETQLSRIGELCDLLEFTAKGGTLEGKSHFIRVNFERDILLPVVQSLRGYGRKEKGTSIDYSMEISNIPHLYLSADGMERCLFNMLYNAIKYSEKNSEIDIGLKTTKNYYEIYIVNKGIGVPQGEEEQIFQRFRQGSNADTISAYGAGLGLYVAREMARIHGGNVKLVSGEPRNTTFAIVLPRSLESGPPNIIE